MGRANHEPTNNVFHILTIHNRHLPVDFVLCQWKRSCLLRATTQNPQPAGKIREVGMSGALRNEEARFITVRGNGAGTDFYVDGLSAGNFPQFVLTRKR